MNRMSGLHAVCFYLIFSQCIGWSDDDLLGKKKDLDHLVAQANRSDSSAVCHGRLTLTSATPVTTSNVTAATTVYFTPYDGHMISLYSGTIWQLVTFTERSVAVPSTTTTPFDVFAYNNSGTVTLETVDWTNDTTRATALTLQDGIYVKSGATTRRYLGTARTTGVSGQTEDSTSKRFLWNYYNRVPRKLLAQASTASWSYATASWRSAGNSTTTGQTRVEYLVGLAIDRMTLQVYVPQVYTASTVTFGSGIGIDSTTSNSAQIFGGFTSAYYNHSPAYYSAVPAVGYHYAQWLEFGEATGQTIYANYSSSGKELKGGMNGTIPG